MYISYTYISIQACLAVEGAAKDGSVSPEVLFDVARRWFNLHEETRQGGADTPQAAVEQPSAVMMSAQQPLAAASTSRQNNNSPRLQMANPVVTMEVHCLCIT